MSEISLTVNGTAYSGFKSILVNQNLDTIAGRFGFATAQPFDGSLATWPLQLGDECTVAVNDSEIIAGRIEVMPIRYTPTTHTIQIQGRDYTGALVDSSHTSAAREWASRPVLDILEALCDPFDIDVSVDASAATEMLAIVTKFKINDSDTVFSAIKRLASTQGFLAISKGDGKLTITKAGSDRATDTLELGKNILEAGLNQTVMDRFSEYIVKGQYKVEDGILISEALSSRGSASDTAITWHRPIVIIADVPATSKDCQTMANWELNNRKGQGTRITYKVANWVQSDDSPWEINKLVSVTDEFLGISTDMLISELSFSLESSTGEVTEITVVDPVAYA